ncbi:MAG: hypothetical protein C0399_06240 [Syntrophus sp. (in: bacteria)]|nr:hypothetical protein [Syntrophus sp. (in: bacteria)]
MNETTMIRIDFRLVDIIMELQALEDHIHLIEMQISELGKSKQSDLEEYLKREQLTPDDFEWDEAKHEYDNMMEFLLPRFFWGSFIVSLYAVYETAVTEIARLIQTNKAEIISMDDLRGDFLERAKKYYKSILHFELCESDETWQRIRMLVELRNAIAHANGRLEMLKAGTQQKIKNWTKMGMGISLWSNYFLVSAEFSKETFFLVHSSLEHLVKRYKEWDSDNRKSRPVQRPEQ